jgi:hypothetical protein
MRRFLALVALVAASLVGVVVGSGSAQAASLNCSGYVYNKTISSVTVPKNGFCALFNDTVSGGVSVSPGAAFYTCNTDIGGGLSASGAYLNMDNSSSIGGSLSINKAGVAATIGREVICETDTAPTAPEPTTYYSTYICPHLIGGSVTVANALQTNLDVTLGDCGWMTIGGPVLIANNKSQVEIFQADINGNLTCVNNHPTAVYDWVYANSISGCALAF